MKIKSFGLEHTNPSIAPMYRKDVSMSYGPTQEGFSELCEQVTREAKINGHCLVVDYAQALQTRDSEASQSLIAAVRQAGEQIEENCGPQTEGGTHSTMTIYFVDGPSVSFDKHRTPSLGQFYWTIAEAMVKHGTRIESSMEDILRPISKYDELDDDYEDFEEQFSTTREEPPFEQDSE